MKVLEEHTPGFVHIVTSMGSNGLKVQMSKTLSSFPLQRETHEHLEEDVEESE